MAGDPIEGDMVARVVAAVTPLVENQTKMHTETLESLRQIHTQQQVMYERIRSVAEVAEGNERVLRGNGKRGLIEVVNHLQEHTSENIDNIDAILELLKGKDDKPGLASRMATLENKFESFSTGIMRPLWVALTALIGTGVTLLINHLLK